jgi:uncharacterized metal-binding protein
MTWIDIGIGCCIFVRSRNAIFGPISKRFSFCDTMGSIKKKTATYDNINPGHGSEQAHIYGGDKLINRIPTLTFLIIGKT